jgi:peroxiredoxin
MDHRSEARGSLVRSRVLAGALVLCAAMLGGSAMSAIAGDEPHGTEQVQASLDEARLALESSRPHAALSILKKVQKLGKGACGECLVLEAQAYVELGRYDKAIKSATRVVEENAPVAVLVKAHNLLALALQRGGRLKPEDRPRVESEYREAIRLDEGEDTALRFNLAIFLLRIDRQEEGRAMLQKILEDGIDPETTRWIQLILAEPDCIDGTCAPEYALTTLDGKFFSRKDLKGKAVLLYFLIPGGSLNSISTLNALAKRTDHEPFALFAISFVDENALAEFGQANKVEFPLCYDRDGTVASAFGVQQYPAAVVIDHRGHMVFRSLVMSQPAHARMAAFVGDAIKKAREAAASEAGGSR